MDRPTPSSLSLSRRWVLDAPATRTVVALVIEGLSLSETGFVDGHIAGVDAQGTPLRSDPFHAQLPPAVVARFAQRVQAVAEASTREVSLRDGMARAVVTFELDADTLAVVEAAVFARLLADGVIPPGRLGPVGR